MRKQYDAILLGSADIDTSIAEQEIIPEGMEVKDFYFVADEECHVRINHGDYVYLRAEQYVNIVTGSVFSCRVLEAGVTFNWAGTITRTVEVN